MHKKNENNLISQAFWGKSIAFPRQRSSGKATYSERLSGASEVLFSIRGWQDTPCPEKGKVQGKKMISSLGFLTP